jgi:S1-C subfamily serine protease
MFRIRVILAFLLASMCGVARGQAPAPAATQPAAPAASQPAPAGAWLGIQLQPDENGQGLVVVGIAPDSPAAAAGFQEEDVIVKVNDQDMKDVRALLARMQQARPGEKLRFTVNHDGNERELSATVAPRPASLPATEPAKKG